MIEQIGLVGCGEMAEMYLKYFTAAGYVVNICDVPERYSLLVEKHSSNSLVRVHKDGHGVSRVSDYVIYSVPTANINCIREYGKSMKYKGIVGGQTSVKWPEIKAYDELPDDCGIVTLHSMHGPSMSPKYQPLVIIPYRATEEQLNDVRQLLVSCLGSKIVKLSWEEHDRMTADTQAVTHLAFLSMGVAWMSTGVFPWETTYVGGIENVKVMMTLRIYASKWHVYAGLAIYNPAAKRQVEQYARSAGELFKMMIQEREKEFRERIMRAKAFVFSKQDRILLSDEIMDRFSLSSVPIEERKPNSHLSLLAIVDSWYHLSINPYDHMLCQTPPFRIWLGIAEYLFRDEEMLEQAIHAALYDKSIRADDLEFVRATQGWVSTILLGSMDGYRERFEQVASFFGDRRLKEAQSMSTELLNLITSSTVKPQSH